MKDFLKVFLYTLTKLLKEEDLAELEQLTVEEKMYKDTDKIGEKNNG